MAHHDIDEVATTSPLRLEVRPTWIRAWFRPSTVAWVGVGTGGRGIVEDIAVGHIPNTPRHLRAQRQACKIHTCTVSSTMQLWLTWRG